jgi:hypothetical protein
MNRYLFPMAMLGLSPVLGCTDQGLDSLQAIEQDALVNGKLSSAEDDAVVSLTASGSGCTGTLIAPTVMLTALHCVTGFDSTLSFTCQSDGTLAPGSANGKLGETVDPKGIIVRTGVSLPSGDGIRGKAIYSTEATDVCHDDLAVVVLESAPDIGDAPLVALRFAATSRKGQLTRIVGYGDVEQTDTLRGRQVRTDISVRGVGGPDASTPGDKGILPRTVQIAEGPCHGDSGGPLFSQDTGAQIGVFSLIQNTTCTGPAMRNSYTQISYWEPLIREALASEGYEPILEPDEPTGAGGEAGATSVPGGGGSGGTEGSSGGTGGTSEPVGEGAAPAEPDGTGRGSFKDSSCSYRAAREQGPAPWWSVAFALGLAVYFSRRAANGFRRA